MALIKNFKTMKQFRGESEKFSGSLHNEMVDGHDGKQGIMEDDVTTPIGSQGRVAIEDIQDANEKERRS